MREGATEQLEQAILWRRLDSPGHDACGLWRSASGWLLAGTAVFDSDGRACHLRYEVECDDSWRALRASVAGWLGIEAVALSVAGGPGKPWMLNDNVQPQAADCLDIDLGFTPATNLIPIRRLALEINEEADVPAAWLRFPDFVIEPLDQHYRRTGTKAYAYRAPSTGYTGTLEVAETGFITCYPGLRELERG